MKGVLFIFVEGPDDERFFESIVNPLFRKKFSTIKIWKYSKEKIERRRNFVKSVKAMNADYIYVTDINKAVCITAKKEEVTQKVGIDKDRIIVVVREVEGWYLAGVCGKNLKRLSISEMEDTNNITKEDLNRMIPKRYSRILFMERLLSVYDIRTAKKKNESLKYFLSKYGF